MTSTTIQCLFAIRNERRANDLTIEALAREIAISVQAALLQGAVFFTNAYTAHQKREARRRHHFRRALRSLSYDKPVTHMAAVVAPPAKTVEITDAPQLADAHIAHFASYKVRPVETIPVQDGAEEILPAHVCEFAKRAAQNAPSQKATAS